MKTPFYGAKARALRLGYAKVLKPFFFARDPEDVHDRMVRLGTALGRSAAARRLAAAMFNYEDPVLAQTVRGVSFPNPIGLAAGFDKDAILVDILPSVGFGFVEVGSITGEPCAGNPKPRLWRLKESKGLVVYYGLKSEGADVVSARLRGREFAIPVGTSVAMTNCEANCDTEKGIEDFAKAFEAFADIGAYTTVNVSCPNTTGGQPFMDPEKLGKLLDRLDPIPTGKPVFVKVSPDMDEAAFDRVLAVLKGHRVHGIIISNLTKKRDNPKIIDADVPDKGGISGRPVQELSDRLLSHAYRACGDRFALVGCGGVFSAEDAYRKIRLGASLVQMVTGMIFEGPQVVGEINRGLAELLRRDGFANVSDAVGADNGRTRG